ncbi:MAG: OmpA family protein [Nitrospiraceae bacterium]
MNTPRHHDGSSVVHGVTDLMTSLTVIFILLFAAYVTKVSEQPPVPTPVPAPPTGQASAQQAEPAPAVDVRAVMEEHLQRYSLAVESDAGDRNVLRIVVPEALLNFELDKGTLSRTAEAFLDDAIPSYAALLCGTLRDRIDSLVIEGHTDDRGTDTHNLKLSQERSLNVMIKALDVIQRAAPWAYACFHEKTSASGRGRQDLVYDDLQLPDREKSRRVIFKLRLRSDTPATALDLGRASTPSS